MKPQIKECKKFGTGGAHIVMSNEDIGKKFLILPESSKYILEDILRKYHENLAELTNPLLSDFLTKLEFKTIKNAYKKKIDKTSGFMAGVHKKFLESSFKNLENFKLSDINTILNELEDAFPSNIREKLIKEYYKGKT